MLWKTGWRSRAGGIDQRPSILAFSEFPTNVPGPEQFYVGAEEPYQFRFSALQGWYIGTILNIPSDYLSSQSGGLMGTYDTAGTPDPGGWSLDLDTNFTLNLTFRDSSGTVLTLSTTLAAGFTYNILAQYIVDQLNPPSMVLYVNGVEVDSYTFGQQETWASARSTAPFCLGQTDPAGSFSTAGTLDIVGTIGATTLAAASAGEVAAWSDYIIENPGDIPLLSEFGTAVSDEDRYSAASLSVGTAPTTYTSLITGGQLIYGVEGSQTFDVVRFTPNYP